MRIAFTGHRNKQAPIKSLEDLYELYPDATWIHGGAIGFDTQVDKFAITNGIKTEIIRPDYQRYGRGAPLIRNQQIVTNANLVVACYDGRSKGGTFYTLQLARKNKIPVFFTGIQE